MKKFLVFILAAILSMPVAMTASADDDYEKYTEKQMKKLRKDAEKEASKTAKKLEKEGWRISGTMPIKTAYMMHNLKDQNLGGKYKVYAGQARNQTGIGTAINEARMQAARTIAQELCMTLKNRFVSENSDVVADAIEARLAHELAGVMEVDFEMYKDNKDGTYDGQVFVSVLPGNLKKAKKKAVVKEKLEVADEISDWINED